MKTIYTMTLSEKAEELRRRGYAALHCDWRRPALGTVGLTLDGEGFDEQFVEASHRYSHRGSKAQS
jgi:hypothetical protein